MKFLTVNATVICGHKLGKVQLEASQLRVTIEGRPVLVYDDPESKDIVGCPSSVAIAGIVPCKKTLKVRTGYSDFVSIGGHAVCLDTLTGFTDGTPPGTIEYSVADPGQQMVSED